MMDNKSIKILEAELMKTLSYFEPMSMEFILLDLDAHFLEDYHELTTQELDLALKNLVTQKKIKKIMLENQQRWLKVFPKKSFLEKIKRYLKG